MTILNYPVWTFEPNWSSSVSEMLEWLTDVMSAPDGSEQRRSLRYFPRRSVEFATATEGDARQLLDNMLISFGGSTWYLPLWHEVNLLDAPATAISDFIASDDARTNSIIRAGSIVCLIGDDPYTYELAEVSSGTPTGLNLVSPLIRAWPQGTRVIPVRSAELTDQPQLYPRSSNLVTAEVRFRIMDVEQDAGDPPVIAGPLIVDGLIVNAYHQETGRGGYFHHNSGTSEGQFIFIYACFLAYEQLRNGTPVERATAGFYLTLAQEMLDAMGDGSYTGPMLRQPPPANANTITLIHWLFAARGDIPGQRIVYAYETQVSDFGGINRLIIPPNANGNRVFKVWAVYPGTSELLYDSPYSPAYNIANPGAPTQRAISDSQWSIGIDGHTYITPPGNLVVGTTWKIVYGYNTEQIIPQGEGFEAYPTWTKIEPGYSACAPDTFRWFDQAMVRALQHDTRPDMATKYTRLRNGMRRTAVRGQAISDLREVLQPMPGFDAIPVRGAPDGMYCYSDHPMATGPTVPGANPGWTGFNFWSRADNGNLLGVVPDAPSGLPLPPQVQIGRGFSDQWRVNETYQDPDQFLYIEVCSTRVPNPANGEHFLVYVSSEMAFSNTTRWYADLGAFPTFVSASSVIGFLIPRSAFRLRLYNNDGSTAWGSVLPAGTKIENFGISSEMRLGHTIRIRNMRMVSGPSAAWVEANTAEAIKGSKMPFFPGALPFAINADLRRQMFVGWNGSPFHGYQLPDFWWWLKDHSDAVHPNLVASDLPIPNRTTGALTFPISPTTGAGETKPRAALLMEQQIRFLDHAQQQYAADGGPSGFFAHTFVLNTPARASIGNPTPHTWVYTNDDPNTRWVGYQTRIVESLAELVLLTNDDPTFRTARDSARGIANNWLSRINILWPNLDGRMVNGVRIYGMPTDFPNPAISQPQTLYEEPHAAAHILRACVTLKKATVTEGPLYNGLIVRCWNYLEMLYRTSGPMRFTWSPDPAARQWYGFWHGDIIATLAIMLDNAAHMQSIGIDTNIVRQRLVETTAWLQEVGIGSTRSIAGANLTDVYREYHVMTMEPEFSKRLNIDYERNFSEIDNQTSMPWRRDEAGRPFTVRQHAWTLDGRAEHFAFANMLQVLRGRSQPLWVPTFMDDFTPTLPIVGGSNVINVGRCGFTASGGPRWDREDIMIETVGGLRIYRRIIGSSPSLAGDVIQVDRPFEDTYPIDDIVRISFMTLMRLNQDSVEIDHSTDTLGVSTVSATFRSAPDTRIPESAFNE